jgi:RimJ/RimL family protein N-acetyltransferase
LLTGKTVVLRAFEREDLKLVHRWQNDEDVMRLARSSPDHAISREALEARYEKAIKGDDFAEREYIIQERSSEQPIGWAGITIHRWNRRATSADIGLAIGEKDRWRKGYGTEVVHLLLQEAFEQLNLHRVGWWTYAENEGSLALAKKIGFREEGRIRDSVFFDNRHHDSLVLGLLKDEYEEMKKASMPPRARRSPNPSKAPPTASRKRTARRGTG